MSTTRASFGPIQVSNPAAESPLLLRPAVLERRAEQAESTQRAVRALCGHSLSVGDPARTIDHAVLNQVLTQLRLAADIRDATAVRAAVDVWNRSADWRTLSTAVISAEDCDSRHLDGLGDAVYCLRPETRPTQQLSAELASTLRAVATAGFGPLVDAATGVVVRLGPPEPGTSPVSFTLGFLPGTAHIGWSASPADRGESLVHEAAHSWLNECLGRLAATFPTRPLFHSPWRGVPRPPLGLLHAAFAFSTVVCYLDAYPWPDQVAAERRERVAVERSLLERNAETIGDVIAMVPDRTVAEMVHRQVNLALDSKG